MHIPVPFVSWKLIDEQESCEPKFQFLTKVRELILT